MLCDADVDNAVITCSECKLEMCFFYQVPYHKDLTCEGYQSQKAHGDPNYQGTKDFIKSKTKPCPGPKCGVPIMKGEWCFHMICKTPNLLKSEAFLLMGFTGRQCKYEFCWECLASWTEIYDAKTRAYNHNAHKEGCFFRTSDYQSNGIHGESIKAALHIPLER